MSWTFSDRDLKIEGWVKIYNVKMNKAEMACALKLVQIKNPFGFHQSSPQILAEWVEPFFYENMFSWNTQLYTLGPLLQQRCASSNVSMLCNTCNIAIFGKGCFCEKWTGGWAVSTGVIFSKPLGNCKYFAVFSLWSQTAFLSPSHSHDNLWCKIWWNVKKIVFRFLNSWNACQ